MEMLNQLDLQTAIHWLKKGGVLAYPTEAVFGLGCNPYQWQAVERILKIKHRNVNKGLILVASDWEQVSMLVEPIPPGSFNRVQGTWPGPVTWLFPASEKAPAWIKGSHPRIALRISNHPVVQQLCQGLGGPIVSTSANVEGQPPFRDYRSVKIVFEKQVDFIMPGKVGALVNPTPIRDALTGDIIRA